MLTRIEFKIISASALSESEVADLQELVVKTLKEFYGTNDNCGEGLFDLDDGSLHFFTYKLRDDLVLEVFLFPRDQAEAILSPHGLSTYELFD